MKEETYTMFEIAMSQIFHKLYGSSTDSLRSQTWWSQIENLKTSATNDTFKELLEWAKNQKAQQAEKDSTFIIVPKLTCSNC